MYSYEHLVVYLELGGLDICFDDTALHASTGPVSSYYWSATSSNRRTYWCSSFHPYEGIC